MADPIIQEMMGVNLVSTVRLDNGLYETIAVRPHSKKKRSYDWVKPLFQGRTETEQDARLLHEKACNLVRGRLYG